MCSARKNCIRGKNAHKENKRHQKTFGAALFKLHIVSFLEFVYTAACVNELLSACEKGMALTANIHFHGIAFFRGARFERGAASTGNGDLVIIGMYIGFHVFTSLCVLSLRC